MMYSKIKRARLSSPSVELTLRDKFALSAPVCPEWFKVNASELGPEPKEPDWNSFINRFQHTTAPEEHIDPIRQNWGQRHMSTRQLQEKARSDYMSQAHESYSILQKIYVDWVNSSNILREQQWSWFYADEMIRGR